MKIDENCSAFMKARKTYWRKNVKICGNPVVVSILCVICPGHLYMNS